MRAVLIAATGLGVTGGCSLLVDTDGLVADGAAPDAAADVSPEAPGGDAAADVVDGTSPADGPRPSETRTFTVGASTDMIRVSGTNVELPAAEINAGLGGGGDTRRTGIRFVGVQLPRAATIELAVLKLVANEAQSGDGTRTSLALEATDNALPWTSALSGYVGRARTGAVAWHSLPAWTPGTTYETPDLASVLQEIVDRPGWTPGNAVVVFWENDGSTGTSPQQRVAAATSAAPDAPALTIRFH